jgi:hypothetical protein
MWIATVKWEWLKSAVTYWQTEAANANRRAIDAANRAESLERQLQHRNETLVEAIANERAAQTRASMLQIENNALRLERAALLARLLPGLELKVPQVGRDRATVAPPGTDFEDMGDDAAAAGFANADAIPLPNTADAATMLQELIGAEEPDEADAAPGTVLRG